LRHLSESQNWPQFRLAVEMRWREAWLVARSAAQMLRRQFGVRKVAVFGSLIHRMGFTSWSGIDLAAWGIPHDRFYTAVAAVTGLSTDFKLDLVDPATCRPAVREALEREGSEQQCSEFRNRQPLRFTEVEHARDETWIEILTPDDEALVRLLRQDLNVGHMAIRAATPPRSPVSGPPSGFSAFALDVGPSILLGAQQGAVFA